MFATTAPRPKLKRTILGPKLGSAVGEWLAIYTVLTHGNGPQVGLLAEVAA